LLQGPVPRRIVAKPIPLQHLHGALLRRLLLPGQFDLVFMLVPDPAFRNNHFRAQAYYHVEGTKVLH
jgi:hypothetical protein